MATHDTYRERLWPRWPLLAAITGAVGMLAFAYGAALGAGFGWAVGVTGLVVIAVVVIATTPVIAVTADGVRAGTARLPWAAVGVVSVVDRAGLDAARAPGARDFFVIRGPRRGVRIAVTDPADPHTAWVLSSARPRRLADVVHLQRSTTDALTGAGPEGRADD